MSGIISGLAGAGGAANTAGQYYQNAAGQIVNATGSPAAATFNRLQMAALRPEFQQSNEALSAQLAAQGLGGSGAGRALGGSVASNEAGTLAQAAAPLYSQALNQYGQIIGQEPGAQVNAYQQAIDNFYTGVTDLGQMAAGIPPSAQPQGGPIGGTTNPWNPDSSTYVPGFDTSGDTPWSEPDPYNPVYPGA